MLRCKIILMPAPPDLLKGWQGRLIFRSSGLFIIKSVKGSTVYYYPADLIEVPEDNDCIQSNIKLGFYQPVAFLPEVEQDIMYQSVSYHYWRKCLDYIAKTKSGVLSPINYNTPLLHVRSNSSFDAIKIGSASVRQDAQRFCQVDNSGGW